jgi:N-acetylmuramoyl-L-alanine amidase
VVIDAGHGGHDRGGGPRQRIPEKPYTLDVAKRLQSILASAGYRTVMTRSGDYFVGLGGRCAIANRERDAIFVSIHFNSAPREGADGIETYYYTGRSGGLAAAVHREVVRAAGTDNRGVRRRGFYVIRNTRIPSILCELGFLTNRAEAKRISGSSAYRQKLAEAVARGIRAWD